ncbi:hypothetical protein RB3662 [Rhodopirellula baltica SH 1]|uniref:Uncharacterized protein n=1 Tax=Rhodopirellula baltica (strain DSM 10527 / NCIMB 13988 / SH1) TaxID=243090 RepID=Q7UTV4_RHOBA|nr:hypothetical protein RB3662 [Rhodopirellula baltica SH 1]
MNAGQFSWPPNNALGPVWTRKTLLCSKKCDGIEIKLRHHITKG